MTVAFLCPFTSTSSPLLTALILVLHTSAQLISFLFILYTLAFSLFFSLTVLVFLYIIDSFSSFQLHLIITSPTNHLIQSRHLYFLHLDDFLYRPYPNIQQFWLPFSIRSLPIFHIECTWCEHRHLFIQFTISKCSV